MQLFCQHVYIRFSNANLQQQRISASDFSGSKYLYIEADPEFITVCYMFRHEGVGKRLKVLIFNKEEVVELQCEGSLDAEIA